MFLLGTIINAIAVLAGSTIGLFLPEIPERIRNTVMQALALCVILIGLDMALKDTSDILLIITSMVFGTLVGEWMDIEGVLYRMGKFVERRVKMRRESPVAEAFVAASLLYCVGSLSIIGAIQSGMLGVNKTLYAKSILDGFSSVVFTSTLGPGAALAAVPVFFYEGLIALFSHFAGATLNAPAVITCITATGGLMIVGIGLNVYGLKKLAVGNLLPALAFSALFKWLAPFTTSFFHVFMHSF